MALIKGSTRNRAGSRTRTSLARIRLRAGIAVAAHGAIRLVRIGANAGACITRSRVVALIKRHAHDGVCPRACARLA